MKSIRKSVEKLCKNVSESICALIKKLPVGRLHLRGLFLWWFLRGSDEYSLDSERMTSGAQEERGHSENVPNSDSHKNRFLRMCVCVCNHVRSPAAVGGESNSDKQLCCYKGGRKSIKRDNKIAIEFL